MHRRERFLQELRGNLSPPEAPTSPTGEKQLLALCKTCVAPPVLNSIEDTRSTCGAESVQAGFPSQWAYLQHSYSNSAPISASDISQTSEKRTQLPLCLEEALALAKKLGHISRNEGGSGQVEPDTFSRGGEQESYHAVVRRLRGAKNTL